VITLTIPESTPSLNRTLHADWRKKIQMRKHWRWLVRAARLDAKMFPTAPYAKAKVTIVRHGKRICDTDNLYGGCKSLVDCLKHEGIILDDTPAHVELVIRQQLSKTPHTVVTIEPIQRTPAVGLPRGGSPDYLW